MQKVLFVVTTDTLQMKWIDIKLKKRESSKKSLDWLSSRVNIKAEIKSN